MEIGYSVLDIDYLVLVNDLPNPPARRENLRIRDITKN